MSELLTPTEIDYWANAIRLGGDFSGSRVNDLVRLLEERSNARLRERIEKLEAECEFVKAQKESLQRTAEFAVSLHEGRMYYFDAQKAMEHSERLHELLAEWRKGQKERKW